MQSYRSTKNFVSVYVGNLPVNITQRALGDLFEQCGQIGDIYVRTPPKESKYTYAFVRFLLKEDALEAIETLDGWPVMGQRLQVQLSEESRDLGHKMAQQRARVGKASDEDILNLSKVMAALAQVKKDQSRNQEYDPIEILQEVGKAENGLLPAFSEMPNHKLNISILDSYVNSRATKK